MIGKIQVEFIAFCGPSELAVNYYHLLLVPFQKELTKEWAVTIGKQPIKPRT